MIRGAVNALLDPSVTLSLLDIADSPLRLDAAIDSGFSGFLALPTAVLVTLGHPAVAGGVIQMADGSWVPGNYYYVRLEWDGSVRTVQAIEIAGNALLGMKFLWGYRVTFDAVVGGEVTISPIP
jgi:predicted aspartyl protease